MKKIKSQSLPTVHSTTVQGLPVQTGDILCTTDGNTEILPGEFWRLIGKLLPGPVDHIVIYIGPHGRCIEASGVGVISFEFEDSRWDGTRMLPQRKILVDTLYGVAYPLQDRGLPPAEEVRIRAEIAAFCLAQIGKPYNLNFLNPNTDDAFYCSQLAYRAYLRHQIDLNSGLGMPNLSSTEAIIFPQEIWDNSPHSLVRPEER